MPNRFAPPCPSPNARASAPTLGPRRPGFTVAGLLIGALLLAGCGISFGEAPRETEVFEDLRIEGDFVPSASLSLTLDYKRQYPVAVIVSCDLLRESGGKRSERVISEILTEAVPANAEGGPAGEATPVPGTLEAAFIAPGQPGSYLVECYTVLDDNNAIVEELRIRGG